MPAHRIGIAQGTALSVGSLVGGGLLTLPAVAARQAGPASLLVWAALVLACIPVAAVITALSMRYPGAGGTATFAEKAFGEGAAAAIGWLYFFAEPLGSLSVALLGAQYAADVLGGDPHTAMVIAVLLVAVAYLCNWVGLHLSGRVQLVLVFALVALILVAVLLALPRASAHNLAPVAPHGWRAAWQLVPILFFSFVGWEVVSHLSGEFHEPRRQLPVVTALTIGIIALLYLGMSFATVAVLGPASGSASAHDAVPLTALLESSIGEPARAVTTTVATLLAFCGVNVYVAAAGRLGASLGRDGHLPGWLGTRSTAGATPRRSLGALAVLSTVVAVVTVAAGLSPADLASMFAACVVVLYVATLAAGVRLLDGIGRTTAVVALGLMTATFPLFGVRLLYPALAMGAALAYRWWSRRVVEPVHDTEAALATASGR